MVAGTQRSAYSSYCLLLQTLRKVSAGLRLYLVCLEGTAAAYVVVCMGGVKVALRIDSRDASDFAKKFDLNL